MKVFANDAALQAAESIGPCMNSARSIAAFLIILSAAAVPLSSHASEEGVAVAIIYDTSGSMKQTVTDAKGRPAPKYVIANRALSAIANQLEGFVTNKSAGTLRKVEAGVFVFDGNSAREAVTFGPFNPKPIREFAKSFSDPTGSTPLGNALNVASRRVLDSPMSRKHVLIITDGQNTAGPDPASVLPRLQQRAQTNDTTLSVHFIAFDVEAKVFDAVKKQGATVVAAADEQQLNNQLQFIMQRKILLEEEEPPKKQ